MKINFEFTGMKFSIEGGSVEEILGKVLEEIKKRDEEEHTMSLFSIEEVRKQILKKFSYCGKEV